jgi:hypothetical protein
VIFPSFPGSAGECSREALHDNNNILSESGGYRATCTELVEVSRDNVQDLRINRMFDNGWVDEFLGMFDICFSMILLIT